MTIEIEILDDPARACAAMMVGAAAAGGDVVLTGGSTPRTAYEEFVIAVAAVGVDLTSTSFWFGDERCVAPEDPRSNYRMACEALFDRLGAGNEPAVHRIEAELGPERGAEAYERQLRDAGTPEFDLLLLGLGGDGHLASLFPDQASLQKRDRLVVGVPQAGLEPFVPRVSLTLPAIAAARKIVYLVTGSSKADAVAAAFGPDAKPDPHVPSSLLPPLAHDITVLLDPPAAERL